MFCSRSLVLGTHQNLNIFFTIKCFSTTQNLDISVRYAVLFLYIIVFVSCFDFYRAVSKSECICCFLKMSGIWNKIGIFWGWKDYYICIKNWCHRFYQKCIKRFTCSFLKMSWSAASAFGYAMYHIYLLSISSILYFVVNWSLFLFFPPAITCIYSIWYG